MDSQDLISVVKQTFSEWQEDKVSRLAAALAYFAVFSIPPVLVIAIAIAGMVYGQQAAQQQLLNQLNGVLGEQGLGAIETILQQADRPGGELLPTVISLGLLFFAGSAVFVQLQDAMNTIWGVAPDPDRGIMGTIKDRLFSFILILGIGLLLLASLVVSALLSTFNSYIAGLFPGASIVLWLVNLLVSLGVVMLLFAAIFKVIPDVEIAWSDVWVGAFITAVLFQIGQFALSIYLGRSSPASAYGAAGSIIVLLLWIYYTAQILFLGAEFTQVYANRYGSHIRPDEDAVPLTEEARAQQGIPHEERVRAAQRERSGR